MVTITRPEEALLEPLDRLLKVDVQSAAVTLSEGEIRFLVDLYYQIQEFRKSSDNQVRSLGKEQEPHEVLSYVAKQVTLIEGQIKRVLEAWTSADPLATWAKSITGIGPVISAGLRSHIDIEKAPTVGHIWRFAGLDPTDTWGKGQKRPWNAQLKTLCWRLGDSFVKFQNHPNDTYGKIYRARRALEDERNAAGLFAEQARVSLETKRFKKDTDALKHYQAGRLPPARLLLRAERYTVKLFLSHWHEAAWWLRYGERPVRPYVLEHIPGHHDYIGIPNPHLLPGYPENQDRLIVEGSRKDMVWFPAEGSPPSLPVSPSHS